MGSFSSTSKTKSKETVAPSDYSKPYIDDAAAQFKPAYEAAQANNARLQPRIDNALDYYSRVQNGDYLQGNPYLDSIVQQSNEGIRDNVSSQFSTAGRYGSGNHAAILAKQIGDNENRLRYQDYGTERGYQNDAGRGIAGLVGLSSALPQSASDAYAQQINSLLGKYVTGNSEGTTRTTQPWGPGAISAVGSIASAFAGSDIRLKTNIVRKGEFDDGLGVYEFDYIPAPNAEIGTVMPDGRHVGVMAHEVAKLRPWALGPIVGGYATVCYGGL